MSTIRKTITLTEKLNAFVKAQTESGDYGNDSEYIRDLIRRDFTRKTKREAIRQALIEAEQSATSDRTPQQIMEAVEQRLGVNAEL